MLFSAKWNNCTVPGVRFVSNTDPKTMLAFIDGACTNNGNAGALGGSAVVFAPRAWFNPIERPLPMDGHEHTNNRAELMAAIDVLGARVWYGEGFDKLVLATDSELIVKGVDEWVHKWQLNGWKTSGGSPVKNRDLWEMLLGKLKDLEGKGFLVQFWWIPREWNEADAYAKHAAAMVRFFFFLVGFLDLANSIRSALAYRQETKLLHKNGCNGETSIVMVRIQSPPSE